MLDQTISYASLIPRSGFRWLYRGRDGLWKIKDLPTHWAPEDRVTHISEADALLRDVAHQTGFFLAANFSAFRHMEGEMCANECEGDLYLKLASEAPYPATIWGFANRLGLLRPERSLVQIAGESAKEIGKAYKWPLTGPRHDVLFLRVESAIEWQEAFVIARRRVQDWAALESEHDYPKMGRHLRRQFDSSTVGNLSYRVSLDPYTGRRRGEIVASSLAHLLDVQWAMSIEAGEVHRRCPECTTWFVVHPNAGRPEKQYCSNACRMRAYRRRRRSTGAEQ
jgi:hypothetical protein